MQCRKGGGLLACTTSSFVSFFLRRAGKDGSYGTSIPAYKAMDVASDVILAYKHNGRLLTPDHVRTCLPAQLWWQSMRALGNLRVIACSGGCAVLFYGCHGSLLVHRRLRNCEI